MARKRSPKKVREGGAAPTSPAAPNQAQKKPKGPTIAGKVVKKQKVTGPKPPALVLNPKLRQKLVKTQDPEKPTESVAAQVTSVAAPDESAPTATKQASKRTRRHHKSNAEKGSFVKFPGAVSLDKSPADTDESPKSPEIKKGKVEKKKEAQNKKVMTKKLKAAVTKGGNPTRYTLFVGGLPYESSKADIEAHFKDCTVRDVRIMFEKETNKARGFAFVEFVDEQSMQKALSLHHSMLGGRRINVCLSAHRNPDKQKQVKQKNMKLHALRRKGVLLGAKPDAGKRSGRRARARKGPLPAA